MFIVWSNMDGLCFTMLKHGEVLVSAHNIYITDNKVGFSID